jgi:nucleoside-diphosphate-sugar epimerase
MSDGSPWRPIVHIRDVCSAFIAGIEAPASIVSGKAFNVGVSQGNYTVRDIAEAAQRAVPGCDLIFTGEHTDPRTYRVSFTRILTELEGYYNPKWDLEKGGNELVEFFDRVNFTEQQFRGRETIRLNQLSYLKDQMMIDDTFRFK